MKFFLFFSYGYVIVDWCIISFNLNCIVQLKQFYNIATNVSCRKKVLLLLVISLTNKLGCIIVNINIDMFIHVHAFRAWWRHQMETLSALLALCAGNSPVPVNSPHKGQWRGALMFSFIYAWINDWVNNREAGDLRRQDGHYDVIVMVNCAFVSIYIQDVVVRTKYINFRRWFWTLRPLYMYLSANNWIFHTRREICTPPTHSRVSRWFGPIFLNPEKCVVNSSHQLVWINSSPTIAAYNHASVTIASGNRLSPLRLCLNQCWFIVSWTLSNKLQWNSNQNTKYFIHENASGNVCENATILSSERWINEAR